METDFTGKCGSCSFAEPCQGTPKGRNSHIKCNNQGSSRANTVIPRAKPGCCLYEQEADGEVYDPVNRPSHYCHGKYECIDEMVAVFGVHNVIAFCKCNAWKYRYRADHKGGAEDLAKAEWYIGKLMELQKHTDPF